MEDSTFGSAGANADLGCQIYVAAPSRDRLMERVAVALNVSLGPDRAISYGCVEVEWEHNGYEGTGTRSLCANLVPTPHQLLSCRTRQRFWKWSGRSVTGPSPFATTKIFYPSRALSLIQPDGAGRVCRLPSSPA